MHTGGERRNSSAVRGTHEVHSAPFAASATSFWNARNASGSNGSPLRKEVLETSVRRRMAKPASQSAWSSSACGESVWRVQATSSRAVSTLSRQMSCAQRSGAAKRGLEASERRASGETPLVS